MEKLSKDKSVIIIEKKATKNEKKRKRKEFEEDHKEVEYEIDEEDCDEDNDELSTLSVEERGCEVPEYSQSTATRRRRRSRG